MFGRFLRFFSLLLFTFQFLSCDDGVSGSIVKPNVVEKGDTASRTLIVYMMAENSLSNYAGYDLKEIEKAVVNLPHDCRLFVYVDDASFPTLYHYFRMSNGEAGSSVFHPFDNDICSSDTAALGAVFDYILEDYPTKKLDLVLWSHADGWLRGKQSSAPWRSIGVDNGKNSFSNSSEDVIEVEELAALLGRLPVKVDRLVFDACFMQCVEVVYALRNAAEWIIASPAEIPGHGADYSTLVPAFFGTNGPVKLVDSYIEAYANEYAGAVLSAVRPANVVNLADVTYYYVNKYFNINKNRDYADVFAYLPGGKYFGSTKYTSYYDMNAVMLKHLEPEEYAHWRAALDEVVAYSASSPKWYSAICGRALAYNVFEGCALSMFMPQNYVYMQEFNEDFRTLEWYSAAGWDVAGW